MTFQPGVSLIEAINDPVEKTLRTFFHAITVIIKYECDEICAPIRHNVVDNDICTYSHDNAYSLLDEAIHHRLCNASPPRTLLPP
jgi:hypothetical protein